MSSHSNVRSSSPCCIACSRAGPIGRRTAGARTTGSTASRGSTCITFIGQWRGWVAEHPRPPSRNPPACRNHQEAAKDAADRSSIVAALERQFTKGDKALVGNTGFRRYLKTVSDQHFAIDPDKIEEEKKIDGIFVLRTN